MNISLCTGRPVIAIAAMALAAIAIGLSTPANADTITFGGLTHGQVVPTTIGNVSFDVVNDAATGFDEGRIFNSELTVSTADPDLQRDPVGSRSNWKGGNLPTSSVMGNILIVQEHDSTEVDDEGDRPAGRITLTFTTAITEFGLDLVDIENGGTPEDDDGFLEFFSGGNSLGTRSFVSFASTNGPSGVAVFGDATVNRIDPILASAFGGAASFDKVVVRMAGSGGIDNLQFSTVPIPAAWLLLGSGFVGLGILARRRRRADI